MLRYEDRYCGETHDCETLEEALEAANESLTFYRKDAVDSSEWSSGVEGIVISHVESDGTATPLYRATYVGTEEDGYDVEILPMPESEFSSALAI